MAQFSARNQYSQRYSHFTEHHGYPSAPHPEKYGNQPNGYGPPTSHQPSQVRPPQNDLYAYLKSLPMFPLNSAAEEASRQAVAAQQAEISGFIQPLPQQTAVDKLALGLISATGGDVFSPKRIENTGLAVAASAQGMLAANVATATLTRWMIPPQGNGMPLLVDVIEFRGTFSKFQTNPIYVKVSRDTKLRVGGKSSAKVKQHGMWKKTWNFKPVESMEAIDGDGRERDMVVLLRLESPTSPIEWTEQIKRFEGWSVPRV